MPIVAWLFGTEFGRQLVLVVSLLIAAALGFLWLKVHYEDIGYNKAMSAIAAQDKKAVERSNNARQTVRECFDSGGTWDVSNGVCDPKGASHN